MVASREELPYYKGVGRQRGRGFGALAQVTERTAYPFLKKYVVPAARRIGADMLGFALPAIADVVSGKQNIKAAAQNVGKQILKKTTRWWKYETVCEQSHSVQIQEAEQSVTQRDVQ